MITKNIDFTGQSIADNRYEVIEKLGEGNMGLVYRARDQRLQTDVVIKVPTVASLEDPEFLERFGREIRSMVMLTHPHVVPIIDTGKVKNVPYVVMRYLSGGSLRDRQYNDDSRSIQQLPYASVEDWLVDVAKALDFVHSENCVHRDVKPGNILFDQSGNVFLSDFGLAKALTQGQESNKADASLTAAGFLVGTPNYVAPELVMGSHYDGRADQYSLAMTVYEVLTGGCPVEGPNASATMVNQTNLVPASLIQIVPGIPKLASDAVDKALAKNPDDRFRTCVQFAKTFLQAGRRVSSPSRNSATNVAKSKNSVKERRSAVRSQRASKPADLPPAPPAMNRSRSATSGGSGTRISRGKNGRVPCPKCKKVLPLKPVHAGRRGRCVFCKALLQISEGLNTLTLLSASAGSLALQRPQGSSLPGRVHSGRTGDTVHNQSVTTSRQPLPVEEDELIIGEELFGWKLSKSTASFLFILLLTVLIGASAVIGYIQSLPSTEEVNKNRAKTYSSRE